MNSQALPRGNGVIGLYTDRFGCFLYKNQKYIFLANQFAHLHFASDDSIEDDEQDKKLTQSQRDFMGGTYRNEYDEDEYGDDDDVEIDDDNYDE